MPEVPGRPEALAGERGEAGTAGAAAAVVSSALDLDVSIAALSDSWGAAIFWLPYSRKQG